jgi:hypothetical protein
MDVVQDGQRETAREEQHDYFIDVYVLADRLHIYCVYCST